jgi:sugar lactone lactonase YvrE
VGFAVPLTEGRFLVGLTRQLAIVDASGVIEKGSVLLPETQRFNDGKVDPQGRLLVGSLWLDGSGPGNALYRLEPDGTLLAIDTDLGLSNGLGWSPDGATFYSIDTDASTIYARPYGDAAPGQRSPLVQLPEGVYPDGMTVDADGTLWVAIWGGSGLVAFGPDGSPLPETAVSIQAPHSSSVTFAGDNLDVIVVTSASRDLSAEEALQLPAAGGLHLVRSEHRGLPATRWIDTPLP